MEASICHHGTKFRACRHMHNNCTIPIIIRMRSPDLNDITYLLISFLPLPPPSPSVSSSWISPWSGAIPRNIFNGPYNGGQCQQRSDTGNRQVVMYISNFSSYTSIYINILLLNIPLIVYREMHQPPDLTQPAPQAAHSETICVYSNIIIMNVKSQRQFTCFCMCLSARLQSVLYS